nr:ubiquitin carboxyl-terminal hydrolase 9-like isoform X2 [Tanacetum cinerariifolium]
NNNYEDEDDDVVLEDGDVEKGEWDWERWKMLFVRVDEPEKIEEPLGPDDMLYDDYSLEYETLVSNKDPSGGSSVYELYAISNNYGGLGGDHYSAYAKLVEEDKWYHFDDSHVTTVSEGEK